MILQAYVAKQVEDSASLLGDVISISCLRKNNANRYKLPAIKNKSFVFFDFSIVKNQLSNALKLEL